MAVSNGYLAEEIIFLILSWLPAVSLVRFRKVCKLWNSIITNPKFIENHRINCQKRQPSLLSLAQIGDVQQMCITCEDYSFRLNLPQNCYGTTIYYVRSCNGLVCLADLYAQVICVCNPSTRQFKILPTPNIKSNCIIGVTLGFGFDFIGNGYKILRMVLGLHGGNGLEQLAEVYTTNADSWRMIETPPIVQKFRIFPSGKCVESKNGVLYLEGTNGLLWFNLHNEVLGVHPYPQKSLHHVKMSDLLDLQGSVAMIRRSTDDESVPSLWLLDGDGGKLSWTKKCNLEGASDIQWIVSYWYSGYFIGFDDDSGRIFYGYKKKETNKPCFPADVLDEAESVVKHCDSLVSLKGFEQLE
ncbi:putative F-box protein At4g21240 [Daucus carota subsp. sativus]|uniref:putative F-box protein At4g21240 n=1 Tax=Daucus carota subsp. sativus TaxID=79200 RepID=UPI0007EF8915|nr:PREDICTED: putative F-box protein At4g21240 [Daucus carota subsp. sativus]